MPKLFKEWRTTCLSFEEDPEPFGRVRDHNIMAMCKEFRIEVLQNASHTLYKLEKIIELNHGRAPMTYNKFQGIIASMGPPAAAEPSISEDLLGQCYTPVNEDHDDKFGVPTLEELGPLSFVNLSSSNPQYISFQALTQKVLSRPFG